MIYREMPPEGLPVTQAADISSKELRLEADVIVVGSGTGGAIAAYELAKAGHKVIILEAGRYVPSSDFKEDLADSMQRMFQDYALQTNATGDLILLQGAMVGGSSVVDATICDRMPKAVLESWQKDFGLDNISWEDMQAHYAKVEKRLSVHENEAHEINDNANIVINGGTLQSTGTFPLSANRGVGHPLANFQDAIGIVIGAIPPTHALEDGGRANLPPIPANIHARP